MPNPERRPRTVCELGVTGKRLRRALPLVQPSPAVRAALWQSIVEVSGVRYQVAGRELPASLTPDT